MRADWLPSVTRKDANPFGKAHPTRLQRDIRGFLPVSTHRVEKPSTSAHLSNTVLPAMLEFREI